MRYRALNPNQDKGCMEMQRHTRSIFWGLRYLAMGFNIIPGVYHHRDPRLRRQIVNHNELAIELVSIARGIKNMRQKSIVCDDSIRRVPLKDSREQLGGAQSNGSDGLLRECEVTDKEL
jgi:hypothetical protein